MSQIYVGYQGIILVNKLFDEKRHEISKEQIIKDEF
jgi:hypothetical protein